MMRPIQPNAQRVATGARVLNSWKEISAYTGRGIRTLQRYEEQLGFPIRRPFGRSHSTVMAFIDEIDLWLRSTPHGSLMNLEQDGQDGTLSTELEMARKAVEESYAAYRHSVRHYQELRKRLRTPLRNQNSGIKS